MTAVFLAILVALLTIDLHRALVFDPVRTLAFPGLTPNTCPQARYATIIAIREVPVKNLTDGSRKKHKAQERKNNGTRTNEQKNRNKTGEKITATTATNATAATTTEVLATRTA